MGTIRQKVCGAILTLAASAFGVDRWTGPGTDEALADAAGTSATLSPTRAAASVPLAMTPPPAGGARSLATRLQEATRTEGLALADVPDGFRPSDAWVRASKPPAAAAVAGAGVQPSAQAGPPPIDYAAQFRRDHRLNAVMRMGGANTGGIVIVTDNTGTRSVATGQALDGFRLVGVRDDGAAFQSLRSPGTLVDLRIDKPKLSGSPRS